MVKLLVDGSKDRIVSDKTPLVEALGNEERVRPGCLSDRLLEKEFCSIEMIELLAEACADV